MAMRTTGIRTFSPQFKPTGFSRWLFSGCKHRPGSGVWQGHHAQVSLPEAGRALAALRAVITTSMRKGGIVNFYGFDRFYVGRRSVRSGRNPRAGATVLIRAARAPRFRASKTGNTGGKFSAGENLKAALN